MSKFLKFVNGFVLLALHFPQSQNVKISDVKPQHKANKLMMNNKY